MRRCFLVCCPRSGSTLLQAMLARHPSVYTIPESHFFQKIRGRLGARSPLPVVSPRAASRAMGALLTACGAPIGTPRIPSWWLGRGRYSRAFRQVLDHAAELDGATTWIEKSPVHLHYLDEIELRIPEAVFVHLLRDGRNVVASLVDLCQRDPELWVPQVLGRGKTEPQRSELIDAAADRWNADLERSLERDAKNGHLLVFYEDLVVDPRQTLEKLCRFLELPYEESMESHWETAEVVIGPRAGLPHMERAMRPLEDRRLDRFHQVFSEAERDLVVTRLSCGGDPKVARAEYEAGRQANR